ncbi:MAG: hypothetical protein EOM21_13655 [Gammaproteobacteria bacterium]|nr:hypothetical protein [Gammaproteobacteria bacterium]
MMTSRLAGRFKCIVYHGDTDLIVKDTDWMPNLITDSGLNALGNGWGNTRLAVGSGVPTPSYTSTAMASWLTTSGAHGTSSSTGIDLTEGFAWSRYSYAFGIGQIQGTIREIGVTGNYATVPTYLHTYAALTDYSGLETELVLGGVDRLTVIYEFRQYWPTSDFEFTFNMNGVLTSCVCRAANPNAWKPEVSSGAGGTATSGLVDRLFFNGIGPVAGYPPGAVARISSAYNYPYVAGELKRRSYITHGTENALTNCNAIVFMPYYSGQARSIGGEWQISLSPAISKSALESLRLDWEVSWNRYEP